MSHIAATMARALLLAGLRRIAASLPARAIDADHGTVTDAGAWLAANGRDLVAMVDDLLSEREALRSEVALLRDAACVRCAGDGAA